MFVSSWRKQGKVVYKSESTLPFAAPPEPGRDFLPAIPQVPVSHTLEECLEYTRSDRYAGMMLVWRSYNYLSLDYTKYYQRLVTIEQDGVCCGFGPPTRCTVRKTRCGC